MGQCCSNPSVKHETRSVSLARMTPTHGGLSSEYQVQTLLGVGATADAYLCSDNVTGELVAIKLIKRPVPRVLASSIVREVKIQAALGAGHINIVKPKDVILTRKHLGIVMEYVSGGNLATYIQDIIAQKYGAAAYKTRTGTVLEEDEALYFYKQIIAGLEYCHTHNIAHRDLKLDNTLLDKQQPPCIKLCDFGYANWWEGADANMDSFIGTPDYMSPQLLKKSKYDARKADIWASGVLLCTMLFGKFPFDSTDVTQLAQGKPEDICNQIAAQQTKIKWSDNPVLSEAVPLLSPDCRDFLDRLFDLDEMHRMDLHEVKAHAWFSRPLPDKYQGALEYMAGQQAVIDAKVQAGAFVNPRRDAALQKMIGTATHTYNPEEEPAKVARLSAQMVKRISLVRVDSHYTMDASVRNGGASMGMPGAAQDTQGHMDQHVDKRVVAG